MHAISRLTYQSIREPLSAVAHSFLVWVLFAGGSALAIEQVWVMRPKIIPDSGPLFGWTLAGLGALAGAAAYFRLPIVRRLLPTRYLVRTVQSDKQSSDFNLENVTSVLRRELARWPDKGGEAKATTVSPAATLTVAHFSLPLEWLWAGFRRLITGAREVTIETALCEMSDPPRLVSWVTGRSSILVEVEISGGSVEVAARDLAILLIKEIDPKVAANIWWALEHFDRAIDLLRHQPQSIDRDLLIASILIQSNQDQLAREQLDLITTSYVWISRSRMAELAFAKAQFYTNIGEFDAAKEVLLPLLHAWAGLLKPSEEQARRAYSLLGDCERDAIEGVGEPDSVRYELAVRRYGQTEKLLIKAIQRRLRLAADSDIDRCLTRAELLPDAELDTLLGQLDVVLSAKATCDELWGGDPQTHYQSVIDITTTRLNMGIADQWYLLMRMAQMIKYCAFYESRNCKTELLLELYQKSYNYYAQAVALAQASVNYDYAAAIGRAWCECGRLQCLHAYASVGEKPDLSAGVVLALSLLDQLSSYAPEEARNLFDIRWQRIRRKLAEDESRRDERQVFSAALFLTEAILNATSKGIVAGLVTSLESQATDLKEIPSPSFVRMIEEASLPPPQGGWFEAEDKSLLNAISRVLLTMLEVPESELVFAGDASRLKEQTITQFADLDDRHQGEAAYGLACLTAILNKYEEGENIEDTLRYLGSAIRGSRSFIGRARIDPDFWHLRDHVQFRELLEYPVTGTISRNQLCPEVA